MFKLLIDVGSLSYLSLIVCMLIILGM